MRQWGLAGLGLVMLVGIGWTAPLAAEDTVPSLGDTFPELWTEEDEPADPTAFDESTPGAVTETSAEGEPLRISMEFQDANLKDVLKAFSQKTGINLVASADVADTPVTLYVEDVTPLDALDQLLRISDLAYERPSGSDIYLVKPREEAAELRTITRVYRLKYARVSESILAKAAAAFGATTPFEASRGLVTPGTGGQSGGGVASTGGGELVGLDVVLQGLLTEYGELIVDGRTNTLIVTDVPENFPRIEAALATLDVRTAQVMIDAEIVETTISKLKELGFTWGSTTGQLFAFTTPEHRTRFPFRELLNDETGKSAMTLGKVSLGSSTSVTAALTALEQDSDTKILARPKILTLDNESAVIRLTADEAIGFQVTTGEATTTTQSQPERATTGVVLVVTPQVNDDGYITMLVEPSVTKALESNLAAPTGQSTPRDPKTRSARALVRVRNGETLVIGGLIDRSEEETRRRTPVLSGIPFLGEVFKKTDVDDTATELIVFITPQILDEGQTTVTSISTTAMGVREQEPVGARSDTIEASFNALEGARP